jgi:Oxidoreductase family, NAD-binding Rossmann fold
MLNNQQPELQSGLSEGKEKGGIEASALRIAMLGMISGNGHPFSWSAIINGFDPSALHACPFPVIVDYLSARDPDGVGFKNAKVTHIWTDSREDAEAAALFAQIPHVVSRPEDVIGEVDAVMIATDDGDDHIERARPFVEAGLPVFVDKPLATNLKDLKTFISWRYAGAKILSSSGLRYAPELSQLAEFSWQWITGVTCNTWKRYGIHILEPIYVLTEGGFLSVRSFTQDGNQFVELVHRTGRLVTLAVLPDAKGAFGTFHAYGKGGELAVRLADTYTAFRSQLVDFVNFVATGNAPYCFTETVELMTILLAADESLRRGGVTIDLLNFQKEIGI